MLKKILAASSALMMIFAAGCSEKSSSSSVSEQTSSVSSADDSRTDYAEPTNFNALKEAYEDNYCLKAKTETAEFTFALNGALMYSDVVSDDSTIITMSPEDGKIYRIIPDSKVYTEAPSGHSVKEYDPLFGATGDFESAYSEGGKYYEKFKVDSDIAKSSGTITYIFSQDGSLEEYDILISNSPMAKYTVTSLEKPTDDLFVMPDISGYSKQG